jgi:hypothetical protein
MENGETNYYAQFWDFNPDGTITLNLFSPTSGRKIIRKERGRRRFTPSPSNW